MKCKLNHELECLGPEGCNILGCALDSHFLSKEEFIKRWCIEENSIIIDLDEIHRKKLESIDHILTYGE